MLKKVHIQNFKSIADETIELGRINVFIGENGCGKSNLLEAFAYLAGAMSNRLTVNDIELRGVRVARPDMTVSAFEKKVDDYFFLYFSFLGYFHLIASEFKLSKKEIHNIYADWHSIYFNKINNKYIEEYSLDELSNILFKFHAKQLDDLIISDPTKRKSYVFDSNVDDVVIELIQTHLSNYLIYQFETSALRGMGFSNYVKPLGINGEGLDVLFEQLDDAEKDLILAKMSFIGWLSNEEGVQSDKDGKLKRKGLQLGGGHSSLYFKDKYLYDKRNLLSAENANEGVLHLLACITAVVSSYTPRFFAIDNVDATLNPRLCRALTKTLADLVVEKDKQLLLTTQNPAILDGLDIYDEDQRLFAVSRDSEGKTRVRRIKIKEGVIFNENDPEGDVNGKKKTAKLSEMWMNGLLGAVPKFQM